MENPKEDISMQSSEILAGIIVNFIKLAKKTSCDSPIIVINVEARYEDGRNRSLTIK